MKEQHGYNHIYDLCKRYMHSYVLAETVDGSKVDGIITGLDNEYVYFAVPINSTEQLSHQNESQSYRQFGPGYGPGYGLGYGPGYDYGPGYGYPGYGYSGSPFRRLILPLTAIAALSLLPWY